MAKAIDMEEARAKLKTVSNVAGERQADERELKEYRVALKAAGLDSVSDDDWIIRGTDSALDMTPMDDLIPGIIPDRSVGALIGAPNAGKTFLAQYFLKLLAEGGSFNGNKLDKVGGLYIGGEGEQGHERRMAALYKPMAEDEATALGVNANDFGQREKNDTIGADLRHFPRGLEPERACARLYKIACKYRVAYGRLPGLIIVDHFGLLLEKGSSRSDDHAVESIYSFVRTLAKLLECTILILVHTNKDGKEYSGSVTQAGAWDFARFVAKESDATYGEDATHVVSNKKQRDGLTAVDGLEFKLRTRVLGKTPKGMDYTSAIVSFNKFGAVDDDDGAKDLVADILQDSNVRSLDDLITRFLDGYCLKQEAISAPRLIELLGPKAIDTYRVRSKVRGGKPQKKQSDRARGDRVRAALDRLEASGMIAVENTHREGGGAEKTIRKVERAT